MISTMKGKEARLGGRECAMKVGLQFETVVRQGLNDNVTFEQTPEGDKQGMLVFERRDFWTDGRVCAKVLRWECAW